jgi:hypothetical protein
MEVHKSRASNQTDLLMTDERSSCGIVVMSPPFDVSSVAEAASPVIGEGADLHCGVPPQRYCKDDALLVFLGEWS